jgi:hypothetical protein
MTLPRPRLTFVGLPRSERVDVSVTFVSTMRELTVETVKLGAFRVLTLMVEIFAVVALIEFVEI